MVRVTGRVQGVGFREWTVREAQKCGLEGWVRNQPDGSVKAVIAGGEEAVSTMLEAFMHGPGQAVVADVVWEPAEDLGLSGFQVAP
jgi:acylphosphatase